MNKYAIALYNKETKELLINALYADNAVSCMKEYLTCVLPSAKKVSTLVKKVKTITELTEIAKNDGCTVNMIRVE